MSVWKKLATAAVKAAPTVAKVAGTIVVTSVLTHRTIKAVAIDAARDAVAKQAG